MYWLVDGVAHVHVCKQIVKTSREKTEIIIQKIFQVFFIVKTLTEI